MSVRQAAGVSKFLFVKHLYQLHNAIESTVNSALTDISLRQAACVSPCRFSGS